MKTFCGYSKIKITPEIKLPLAGYSHRLGNYKDVKNDIYVKTIYFECNNTNKKLIISADLIWWDLAVTEELRDRIEERFKIPKHNILFTATHTHCGPQISNRFTPALGVINKEYISFLKKKTLGSVKEALQNLEECKFFKTSTTCNIGINRRLKNSDGTIEMAPNPVGVNTTTIQILEIKNLTDKLMCILVHGICHANVSAENSISPDFPGIAMNYIEENVQGVTAVYLQGFCGDIRPNIQSAEKQFIRSDNKKAEEIGIRLGEKVISALKTKESHESFYSEQDCRSITFTPDFVCYPSKKELEKIRDNEKRKEKPDQLLEWAETMLNKEYYKKENISDILIQCIPITNDFVIVGINSEIVVDYHFYLKKKIGDFIIPTAYSNGMIGYLATKHQLSEGGYEAFEMYKYFALPSPFKDTIEYNLKQNFSNLMENIKWTV